MSFFHVQAPIAAKPFSANKSAGRKASAKGATAIMAAPIYIASYMFG
jgi:hypothetical protein